MDKRVNIRPEPIKEIDKNISRNFQKIKLGKAFRNLMEAKMNNKTTKQTKKWDHKIKVFAFQEKLTKIKKKKKTLPYYEKISVHNISDKRIKPKIYKIVKNSQKTP